MREDDEAALPWNGVTEGVPGRGSDQSDGGSDGEPGKKGIDWFGGEKYGLTGAS